MTPRTLMAPVLPLLLSAACGLAATTDAWSPIAPHLRARPLSRSNSTSDAHTRFVAIPPSESGIDFVNRLEWRHPRGLLFQTGYACGGIAVGDVDGNGLPDLFFARGIGGNRLYLQTSPWKFVDNSAAAGVTGEDCWGTGAALFDIDNDGDLDLYVSNYDAPNQLFLNRGNGTFDERAADYGLDIVDACLMPTVADFDRDGDLDIYLETNRYLDEERFNRRDLFYWRDGMEYLRPDAEKCFTIRRHFDRAEQLNMWAGRKDRLLRNEGSGRKFMDVSDQMGLDRGDTLSATWWDYDHDGWPDLYVCHDMSAPDRLFHNNRDGSFTDVARQSLPHTPWLAMGSSAGDINNDGLVDFLAADMSFRTHFKDKVFMGDMSTKFRNVGFFPHVQLMRNALFINTGTAQFQEAAYLAGIASTDWTWTAKLADLDNDGRLDAFFTNGSPVNLSGVPDLESPASDESMIDTTVVRQRYADMPPVLEQNLAYRNVGDLHFADHSQTWGLDAVGMSFAAVHADLDRDGDLDLVVANLDQSPTLYRNDSTEHGVLVKLVGTNSNRDGVGAELIVETDQRLQVRQVYPVAGFQSCQESIVHFGLGAEETTGRLTVRWPSGAEQVFTDLSSDQFYIVEEPEMTPALPIRDARLGNQSPQVTSVPSPSRGGGRLPLFATMSDAIVAEHHEQPFDDFARQPLLPNKLSQLGPPMAWGDVDGDGDLDLFLGEGTDWMGMLYLNRGEAEFAPQPQVAFARDAGHEDTAAVFFDANSDGHLDLFVGSGSIECEPGDDRLRDRLYFGDGAGRFDHALQDWLPDLRISTGAVAANDFDQDGDVDLFVGGRSVPGAYPLAPQHALLRNEGERFVNVLDKVGSDLTGAGMITAAAWADVDGDGWDDLIVAVDWGPVRLYRNQQGRLAEATDDAGLGRWTGWWQSLVSADLDNDGDVDLVAGNFGLNTKYKASATSPVLAFYGEYGDSGQRNLIEAGYEHDVLFPLRGKSCSSAAMPHLAERFATYEQFASATLAEIYTPDCLQKAQRFEVNTLASACFLNDGTGRFEMVPLPTAAQLAPVFALAVSEVNGDSVPDLFVGQNFFGPQRETGPMDGGLGVVALGRGDGTFEALRPDTAGIAVPDDVKAVAAVDFDGDGWRDLCVAANNGPVRMFRRQVGERSATRLSAMAVDADWSRRNLALARQFIGSEQHEESLPYLRRALKVAPHDSDALLLLAGVRVEQQRFGEAKELLDRLRSLGNIDDAVLLTEKGHLFYCMHQYDRAAQLLRSALATRPDDRRAQLYLGEVYLEQGRLLAARRHFERAARDGRVVDVDQRAEVARVMFEQGLSAQRAGHDAEAIRLFERSRWLDAQPRTLQHLALLLETTDDKQLRDPWLAEQLRSKRD